MYSVAALKNGIEKCKENIKVFEDAIDKENATIKDYRSMIQTIKDKEQQAELAKTLEQRIEIEIDGS